MCRDFAGERPSFRSRPGNHQLGAGVQAGARVVEGVDGGTGLEVEIGGQIHAAENVVQHSGNVVGGQFRSVLAGRDEQVLGQRALSETKDRVGDGPQLLRPPAGEGRVTLAPHGEQQWMDAGRVHGVH